MCQIMMEDSYWLDTYQSAIIEGCTKPSKKIELLEDQDLCSENTSISSESACKLPASTDDTQISKTFDVNDMPAFEFLSDNKSCVAAKTFNLVKRFMPSLQKTMAPRQDVSFKKSKQSVQGRFSPV